MLRYVVIRRAKELNVLPSPKSPRYSEGFWERAGGEGNVAWIDFPCRMICNAVGSPFPPNNRKVVLASALIPQPLLPKMIAIK